MSDDLSQELKDLIINVIAYSNISVPAQKDVRFERLGLNRGFISSIYKIILDDNRTFVSKITDDKQSEMMNSLHNRELEFYQWLSGCTDAAADPDSKLLKFYGGKRCGLEPGILILNDLSPRIGVQPNYVSGYAPDLVFQIVKGIVSYQSVYLSSGKELSDGYHIRSVNERGSRDALFDRKLAWMSADHKRLIKEWSTPDSLYSIYTEIPESVVGVSKVLVHVDLWPGNMLFERTGDDTHLLAFLDWQTFQIGNPLLDIASVIGLCMTTEGRRAHTEGILQLYVDAMERRRGGFKKPFEITIDKARTLLSSALRWPCVSITYAIERSNDDVEKEGEEMSPLSIRLKELMKDVLNNVAPVHFSSDWRRGRSAVDILPRRRLLPCSPLRTS
ncbi:hypothetical protein PENTCL1PPCAC_18854 [Pristionchus entomophagus]|uniref:CHK kinase-like domain-containing protein n=1 Tax=Pristionchus entomophagus TaxID=358040 RepID=A0AAV5TR16_9BILA|nr:hypothetical protein PENTCL1PPCAC_18854 [Pristionchus entomophagus]